MSFPTIVFALPFTVTVPVTMLFANVVLVPEIATLANVLPNTVVLAAILVVAKILLSSTILFALGLKLVLP